MKELSISVRVIPFRKLRKDSYTFLADSFDLVPTPEHSSAGTLYNCNKDIVIDLPPKEVIEDFSGGVSASILFSDNKKNQYTIGTENIPAVISISPNLNSATLKIECKMIHSPLTL